MAIRVLLPKLSLFGLPMGLTMRWAKAAGFAGLELLAVRMIMKHLPRIAGWAEQLGLVLHLHQPWSLSENSTYAHNRVLSAVGYLPQDGYQINDLVPPETPQPLVIYADRFRDAITLSNRWIQTVSVFQRGRDGRFTYQLPYRQFVEVVLKHNLPVVFDTQHFLEYLIGVQGVEKLSSDPRLLFRQLSKGWETLRHLVREIHLNDFNPMLGHTRGRNVFPGTGIVPLAGFMQLVRRSGWQGTVVPEVAPRHLFGRHALTHLRRRVGEFIEE